MALLQDRQIFIPTIDKIEAGAITRLGNYLKNARLNNVVIFFGNGLIDMFGEKVFGSLNEAGIEVLSYQELDDVNIEALIQLAFSLPNKMQAIIGLGGGKVIDAAKYTGFLRDIPFISFPTSSSTDGFNSATASLLVNGRRKSVPAKLPFGVIVDTDIIKTAPVRFLYSGIGDMVSKITAIYDWKFEEAHGYAEVNDVAVMIAKKAVNSFVRTPYESITDDVFLRELMDSLAMSGLANEIAGSSAPTSGSEHLISHALDQYSANPQLHGIQVGIATYLMALVHDHRWKRINTVFTDTGFWDFVETLNLDVNEYLDAIDKAPSMKPFRHTFLHEEKYRTMAKELLVTDEHLRKVFHV